MKFSTLILENEEIKQEDLFFDENIDRIMNVVQDALGSAGIENYIFEKEGLGGGGFYTSDSFRLLVNSKKNNGYNSVAFTRLNKQPSKPENYALVNVSFSKKLTKQQNDIKKHTRIKIDDDFIQNLQTFLNFVFNESNNQNTQLVAQSTKEEILKTLKEDSYSFGGCRFVFKEMTIKENTDKTLMLDVDYQLIDNQERLFQIKLQDLYFIFSEETRLKVAGGFTFQENEKTHPSFSLVDAEKASTEIIVLIRQTMYSIVERGYVYTNINGEMTRYNLATTLPRRNIFDRQRGDIY